ncbi:pyruvate carboxylase [Tuanshanicoccus yangjingiae]|nr:MULTISPECIES: pyruvate carboxylase [unclassified Facklamia]NEW63649.1 pyruvate carboxylase [Facklamia sp. 252]NEW67120.1 pyruvate carboxylase [Facklamia sp. 253]QQD66337.1 pyruvate carboxylase [Aerococcaceae bacterium zg-252]
MNKINKVLIANRGEIAIRIGRACKELGIDTVSIYSKEDIGTLHRQKADESYLIGEDLGPIDAYLDIEGIINLAKEKQVDAIHPGYGFLSENEQFARRCQEEGIIFIGPQLRHLEMFGNKTRARETAISAGLPVIPGTDGTLESFAEAKAFAETAGYPLMMKAVSGGGGKGMRIVTNESELEEAYERVKSEAKSSFGDDRLYAEKYVANPKHIEVQILGDQYGNVVHLFERDCSIQRRHQKVVEVAPSFGLSAEMRKKLTDASLQLMQYVGYVNAGTVEFLVAGDEFYFIEVNPRVQVEHTITELVTGIDIVKSQIQIADGESLFGDAIDLPPQEEIATRGYAIQCRITTEDPLNDFAPDSGSIISYQSPGGAGIRLDAGDAFAGAMVTPYYDSLLVKISSYSFNKRGAIDKMARALDEIKINGLKTNIRFLQNIIANDTFAAGNYDTGFIADNPSLFNFVPPRDRGNKLLRYIANVTVNGFPGIGKVDKPIFDKREIPAIEGVRQGIHPASFNKRSKRRLQRKPILDGELTFKHLLDTKGPKAVADAVLAEKDVLVTDTTLRDAHQSVLTTRLRTTDMLHVAPYMNATLRDSFSLEMWGGATFDVAYNFLKESPWERLQELRRLIPDIPFQMLLRAANAVGYKNYPDNVVERFIAESAKQGIDVFRIFDSLNWLEAMKKPIDAALQTGKLVEGTICYTGDILNPKRSSLYTLDYYVKLAKEIEALGVHTLAIKDMAGLLKPEAAFQLVSALKAELSIPIHLHTHDTAANGIMVYSRAIDAGVDIIDTANPALSGQNSQPNANSLFFARQGTNRQVKIDVEANDTLAEYWKMTRQYYKPFESDLTTAWTAVYDFEMPGGQYSNLKLQAESLGLGDRFEEVCQMYRRVNLLFGDIIKVTPSSKVVGDMALFMVQNDLDEDSVIERGDRLDFPDSVIAFFKGEIGQPAGGWNHALQKVVLKGEQPLSVRAGEMMSPYDFEAEAKRLSERLFIDIDETILLSAALYPKVHQDFIDFVDDYGTVSVLETPTFFYGMKSHETISVEIEPGKTMNIELTSIGSLKPNGLRTIYFNLNGMSQKIEIRDLSAKVSADVRPMADRSNENHIAAQMPGTVFSIKVKEGDSVKEGQILLVTEAMKMETTIQAPKDGVVKTVYVKKQDAIKTGELLVELQ